MIRLHWLRRWRSGLKGVLTPNIERGTMSEETILVVDDEPHIIELATLYLKKDRF